MRPFIHYQGTCHSCQRGYYYPDGKPTNKPDSPARLKCAVCGFDGTGRLATPQQLYAARK